MPFVIVTPPSSAEPVTVAEAKEWLAIDSSDATHDTIIAAHIKTARERIEERTSRGLLAQTWDLFLTKFPDEITLKAPTQSVSAFTYTDTDGNVQSLTVTTDYLVDSNSEPTIIVPAFNKSWPNAREIPNSISIRFVIGYTDAASVPEAIKSALKMIVAHSFENREETNEKKLTEIPSGVEALLSPYRLHFTV